MRYSQNIIINLPVDKVVELFEHPEMLKTCHPDLLSFEHISGEPGQVGAKSKMVFKSGRSTFNLLETILIRNFPEEFTGLYTSKPMDNTTRRRLREKELFHNSFLESTDILSMDIERRIVFWCCA